MEEHYVLICNINAEHKTRSICLRFRKRYPFEQLQISLQVASSNYIHPVNIWHSAESGSIYSIWVTKSVICFRSNLEDE